MCVEKSSKRHARVVEDSSCNRRTIATAAVATSLPKLDMMY